MLLIDPAVMPIKNSMTRIGSWRAGRRSRDAAAREMLIVNSFPELNGATAQPHEQPSTDNRADESNELRSRDAACRIVYCDQRVTELRATSTRAPFPTCLDFVFSELTL
jgi:hypothetical protein